MSQVDKYGAPLAVGDLIAATRTTHYSSSVKAGRIERFTPKQMVVRELRKDGWGEIFYTRSDKVIGVKNLIEMAPPLIVNDGG